MAIQKIIGLHTTTDTILSDNQKTWDVVADFFTESTSALPVWGPFGIGDDLNLIPEIKGKIFLEIACGSGRSVKYLADHGAKKVYGVDLSQLQIDEAERHNSDEIKKGVVVLFQSPMETRLEIEPVDVVFSVYGLGWTSEPEKTLENIFSYLKPGGLFIWSWDHALFAGTTYINGEFSVAHSYHAESLVTIKNWKNREGTDAHITYRKTSTWFQLLAAAGFEVLAYHEPKPKTAEQGSDNPEQYYSFEKAEKVPATFIFVCKKK